MLKIRINFFKQVKLVKLDCFAFSKYNNNKSFLNRNLKNKEKIDSKENDISNNNNNINNKKNEGNKENINEEPESPFNEVINMDRNKFKEYLTITESEIQNYIFTIPNLPDENNFGEVLIYTAPHSVLISERTPEITGALFLSGITTLNYFGLIFPYAYVFPYLSLITFYTIYRYFKKSYITKNFIQSISIINEQEIRITFITGEEIITDIKNIHFVSSFVDQIISSPSLAKAKNIEPSQFGFAIPVTINSNNIYRNAVITIKKGTLRGDSKAPGSNWSLTNLNLLIGILNRKTRKLAIAI